MMWEITVSVNLLGCCLGCIILVALRILHVEDGVVLLRDG